MTVAPPCVSDGSVPLVGAGDPHGGEHPEGGAIDPQPDGAREAGVVPGAPDAHHPLRRGRRHRTHHHIQRYVVCVSTHPGFTYRLKLRCLEEVLDWLLPSRQTLG